MPDQPAMKSRDRPPAAGLPLSATAPGVIGGGGGGRNGSNGGAVVAVDGTHHHPNGTAAANGDASLRR